jgi:hypothetical protein
VNTVAEGAVLGPELITNSGDPFLNTTAIGVMGVALSISDGNLIITSLDGLSDRAEFQLSGLTVGGSYRVTIRAEQGIGVNTITSFTWATIIGVQVIGPMSDYTFIVTATATSGVCRIYAAVNGTAGDFISVGSVSVKQIFTQWLPPTSGTTRSIPTRKGVRQVQTDPEFLGQLIEPAMTNKLTIAKANPTAVTGIVVAGGAAATVVNDPTALTAAGLHEICLINAYNLSIPQNGTVTLPGAVANLNKHSISAELRLVSGTGIQMGLTGALANITLTDAYQRIKQENLTPLVATDLVTFTNLNADTAVVRMILPQLEESPFCTSIIAPAADTAASQTRAASVVSASTSGVFPSTGQDFSLFLERVATAAGQTATLLSTRVDADNLISVSTTATAVGVNLRKTATDNAASAAYTHTAAEKFQAIIVKSAMGISVKVREYSSGAWQAWGAWVNNETAGAKATSPIGTTYQIGALNNLSQFAGNYPRTAIIAMPPKATLAEYQAWIEQELTLRGLI